MLDFVEVNYPVTNNFIKNNLQCFY